ncbi:MAG: ABC transporter ATP-binding protein, partial [Caldisericum exile]
MIKIENLNFGYFDTEVLKGLSIEVKEGETL